MRELGVLGRLTDAQRAEKLHRAIGLAQAIARDHSARASVDGVRRVAAVVVDLLEAVAASLVASREAEGLRVEVVPAGEITKGDDVLITGALGAVRKTVFSTMSSEEDGCALTFTDADSFVLPGLDYMVVRVVAAAPVASREGEGLEGEALERIATQYCREWCKKKNNYCNEPAEFVLWGKLLKPEALGPRCYDHAASHVGHHGLYPRSHFALIDLRPGLAALAASASRADGQWRCSNGHRNDANEATCYLCGDAERKPVASREVEGGGKVSIPRDLMRDEKGIGEWCILHGWRGSIAHGMYEPPENPLSIDDKDTMAVCVPPLDYYYGLREFGSRGTKEIKRDEWDIVVYEVRKAVRMLGQGNPNILSLLWLPESGYIHRTPSGDLLIANRDVFVGRHVYASFVGYATGQLHKMTHGAHRGYMGEKRKRIVEQFGYDTKNAAHLIRLLRVGIEFLRDGYLRVDRGGLDASELLDIKHGRWSLERVQDEATRLFRRAEEANDRSTLPLMPDRDRVNELCVEAVVLACTTASPSRESE